MVESANKRHCKILLWKYSIPTCSSPKFLSIDSFSSIFWSIYCMKVKSRARFHVPNIWHICYNTARTDFSGKSRVHCNSNIDVVKEDKFNAETFPVKRTS